MHSWSKSPLIFDPRCLDMRIIPFYLRDASETNALNRLRCRCGVPIRVSFGLVRADVMPIFLHPRRAAALLAGESRRYAATDDAISSRRDERLFHYCAVIPGFRLM